MLFRSHPYVYRSHHCTPSLHGFTPHISFASDARFIGMSMLLILLIINVPLDNVIRMWVDEGAQRCRACWKPLTLAGRNRNRKFNDHVLKHVSLTVCGICYLTGCTEHITHHCRNFHRQKTRCFPHAYLGRFVIHPNLLEPFIKFSRGRGMTDRRQTSERRLLTRNFQVHLSPR